jgi:hypothetical protein
MRHQLMTSHFAGLGVARWVRPSLFGMGVAWASLLGQGCGQAADAIGSPAPVDLSAEDALRVVESCQAQARDCFAHGDAVVCEEQLRTCLLSALPDAGAPPPRPEAGARPPRPEGGTPPPRPDPDAGRADDDHRSDGGKPNPPRDGGPPSDPRSPDAGYRALPDAARGALTDPVGNDGGPAVHACVNDLRACLATGIRPSICAEESRACLSELRDGG